MVLLDPCDSISLGSRAFRPFLYSVLSMIMSGHVCFLCGKGAVQARLISHANNKTKRKMYPNLRLLKMVVEGLNKRVKLCVKCYRVEREKIRNLKLSQKAEEVISTARAGQKEKTF